MGSGFWRPDSRCRQWSRRARPAGTWSRQARPPGTLDHLRRRLFPGGLEPAEQATRALLGGEREQPVVAPAPVDVEITGRVADLRETELLHDPQAGGVLGTDRNLDTVQPQLEQAVVDGQRHGGRDDILA